MLGLKPGEGARTVRLFAFIFLMTAAIVLAKSAQRGIFLAAYPRTAIPDAFLFSSVALAVASFSASALAVRLGLLRLVQVLLLFGAALLVGAQLAVGAGWAWAPMATYVAVEGLSSLLLVQGWSVATEALDVRSSKRLVPLVSVGAGLAWTLGGLSVGGLGKRYGEPTLLGVSAGLLVLAAFATGVIALFDLKGRSRDTSVRQGSGFWNDAVGGLRYIFSEPLMRVMALVIALDLLVEQVTDFQLLSSAQEWFHAAPTRIASFMGTFYAVTGVLALLAPFTFSGRVLTRFGSARSVALPAAWVLAVSGLFFVSPTFAVIVALSAGDRVLKQALSAPARTQILGAVPAVRRAQAGAVMRGIVGSTLALAGAALLKLFPAHAPVRWLALPAALGAAVLLWAVLAYLRRGYVIALQRTVDRRRLDLDSADQRHLDGEQVALLAEEVRSGEEDRAAFALSILAHGEKALARPLLREALAHPSPEIQAQSAAFLAGFRDPADASILAELLGAATDDRVREAAVRGLADLSASDHAAAVEPFASSTNPRLKALARACLAKFEGSAERFEPLLRSRSEAERAAAASAMGQVQLPMPQLVDAFAPLLNDSSLVVRREAVGAAGWFSDLPIIQGLVFALVEQSVAPAAFDAFSRLSGPAVAAVGRVLEGAPAAVVSRTAAALSSGGAAAQELLSHLLGHEDPTVRYRAARALMALKGDRSFRPDAEPLHRAIRAELERGYRYHATLIALVELPDATAFIGGEIQSRIRQTEERLLALIAVMSDRRIARLSSQLKDATAQTLARVIELLEQSIDRELAELVVPFIERQSPEERAKAASEQFHVPAAFLKDPVLGIIDLDDEHLRRCALLTWRERMTAEYPSVVDRERPLLHLVERIRFLRSVPLFKDLAPEDLMKLAEIAEPVEWVKGHTIFKKGDPGDVLCVVVLGRVEIRDGEHVIASQGPNEFFGELAVLDHEPRSADAVCLEDTELLQIGGPDLEELMERRPEIAREVIRVLARRLRSTTQAMIGSSSRSSLAQPPAR